MPFGYGLVIPKKTLRVHFPVPVPCGETPLIPKVVAAQLCFSLQNLNLLPQKLSYKFNGMINIRLHWASQTNHQCLYDLKKIILLPKFTFRKYLEHGAVARVVSVKKWKWTTRGNLQGGPFTIHWQNRVRLRPDSSFFANFQCRKEIDVVHCVH